MAHLTLVLQGREVRKFVLNASVTSIGRAQDNDIVINNLALSRRHAQVERKGSRFEVSDLGSQNGVFVNNDRIRGARVLSSADTITLGTYQFVFTEAGDAEPRAELVRRAPKATVPVGGYEPVRVATAAAPLTPDDHVPLLVLTYNEVELQRFPLKRDSCVVGRAKECDVQIAERRLSRKHCEIVRMDGIYFVKDLGSQNGTYVNRKRIQDIHELEDGDVLNFAEYAVRYIADDALYDGPDQVHSYRGGAGRPGLTDASREDGMVDDDLRDPLDLPPRRPAKKARPKDAIAEDPSRGRERRKEAAAAAKGPLRALPAAPRRLAGKAAIEVPLERAQELHDVPDDVGDVRPDSRLEDWYKAREDGGDEDPSALLRGQSSVSQILSTMMVEQKELDRNLSLKARQRKFFVDVRHGQERIYQGPLTLPVTILGTDRDADIQLRGRYVAGRHSILVRVKDSLLLVRLGSSSAARVNGLPKLQAFLKTGDVIQIDETTIRIMED